MDMSDSEVSEGVLDRHFADQIRELRKIYTSHNNNTDLVICRKWLQVFGQKPKDEKLARNCLMVLLHDQLTERGYLSEPFTNECNCTRHLEDVLKEFDKLREAELQSLDRSVCSCTQCSPPKEMFAECSMESVDEMKTLYNNVHNSNQALEEIHGEHDVKCHQEIANSDQSTLYTYFSHERTKGGCALSPTVTLIPEKQFIQAENLPTVTLIAEKHIIQEGNLPIATAIPKKAFIQEENSRTLTVIPKKPFIQEENLPTATVIPKKRFIQEENLPTITIIPKKAFIQEENSPTLTVIPKKPFIQEENLPIVTVIPKKAFIQEENLPTLTVIPKKPFIEENNLPTVTVIPKKPFIQEENLPTLTIIQRKQYIQEEIRVEIFKYIEKELKVQTLLKRDLQEAHDLVVNLKQNNKQSRIIQKCLITDINFLNNTKEKWNNKLNRFFGNAIDKYFLWAGESRSFNMFSSYYQLIPDVDELFKKDIEHADRKLEQSLRRHFDACTWKFREMCVDFINKKTEETKVRKRKRYENKLKVQCEANIFNEKIFQMQYYTLMQKILIENCSEEVNLDDMLKRLETEFEVEFETVDVISSSKVEK